MVPPTIGCLIASRVGAGAVWMRGGDACVAQAHRGPFPVSTRFLVEPSPISADVWDPGDEVPCRGVWSIST